MVKNGEALREGYDPKILRTDDGDVIIDGHTRVAMHSGLGNSTIKAQVIDQRSPEKQRESRTSKLESESSKEALDSVIDENVELPDESNQFESMSGPEKEAAREVYERAVAAEPGVSEAVQRLAYLNGGELKGFAHRRKAPESLARKIRTGAKVDGLTPEEAAANIKDSIRYTMQFKTEGFTENAQRVLDELRSEGYTNFRIKNSLKDTGVAYRGVNVTMTSPDGVAFELQFHTPESLQIKTEGDPTAAEKVALHVLYEKYRVIDDKESEIAKGIFAQMVAMSDSIPTPSGIETLA